MTPLTMFDGLTLNKLSEKSEVFISYLFLCNYHPSIFVESVKQELCQKTHRNHDFKVIIVNKFCRTVDVCNRSHFFWKYNRYFKIHFTLDRQNPKLGWIFVCVQFLKVYKNITCLGVCPYFNYLNFIDWTAEKRLKRTCHKWI